MPTRMSDLTSVSLKGSTSDDSFWFRPPIAQRSAKLPRNCRLQARLRYYLILSAR